MAARVSRNLGFFLASPARTPQAVDRLLLDGSDTPLGSSEDLVLQPSSRRSHVAR